MKVQPRTATLEVPGMRTGLSVSWLGCDILTIVFFLLSNYNTCKCFLVLFSYFLILIYVTFSPGSLEVLVEEVSCSWEFLTGLSSPWWDGYWVLVGSKVDTPLSMPECPVHYVSLHGNPGISRHVFVVGVPTL